MFKKITMFILCIIAANAFAGSTEIQLPGNSFIYATNPTSQTRTAQCTFFTPANINHSLLFEVMQGKSEINGSTVNQGQSLVLSIKNAQTISIGATAGAYGRITNLSSDLIRALCSA